MLHRFNDILQCMCCMHVLSLILISANGNDLQNCHNKLSLS